MEVRPMSEDDIDFVASMALLASFPPGPLPPAAAAIPHVRRLVEGWGRPTDIGIVGWEADTRVGAAWSRVFDNPVARDGDGTPLPEVAIAVAPTFRGRGFGGVVLAALIRTASLSGQPALSLTVNAQNPAQRLYERAGFEERQRQADRVVMVREPSGRARNRA
jgi:ribosomal protein S18 acetylase RimI-like enzyme